MSTTIIVVDDNEAHRALVKRAILRTGMALNIIESGSLASARSILAQETPPALIVLDLNLSDGHGTSLLQEARASDSLRKVPIIVLSTSSLARDINASYDCGADCFITKDSDPARFCEVIGHTIKFLLSGAGSHPR